MESATIHTHYCLQIQNTLHRWETGREANIELSADKYRPYYEGHLNWIKAWSKKHAEEWRTISTELGDAAAYVSYQSFGITYSLLL